MEVGGKRLILRVKTYVEIVWNLTPMPVLLVVPDQRHIDIFLFFILPCRSEGPDEPVPVLSVPGRRDVRLLLFSGWFPLLGPLHQAGPSDVVEVVSTPLRHGYVRGLSALFWLSDHDHLRGEVRVRFSAPPSDVVDQNPHDGCHRHHHHNRDSGHLSDLSTQGTNVLVLFGRVIFCRCFSLFSVAVSL